MKVMTVVGTRPELIRLSRIIPLLDDNCDHIFVHTGQNYDANLKDVFFKDLEIRKPDYTQPWLTEGREGISGDIHKVLDLAEFAIKNEKPNKLLILGDTNSGLSAIIAKRFGVKVYHMEAGNRCFDDKVPEEVNRRIIDSCSDILMPYTERSRQNLLREGYFSNKIYVTGNPIGEVIDHYCHEISESDILNKLSLTSKKYFLITMHRSENVDNKCVLFDLVSFIGNLADTYKDDMIVISLHPHTLKKILEDDDSNKFGNKMSFILQKPNIIIKEPFGFFDFIKLEMNSACVISDSGTVQEECCIFNVPSVTIRDVTERPETIEYGSNILVGHNPKDILKGVEIVLKHDEYYVDIPPEYGRYNVSRTVLKIILGVQ